MPAPDPTHPAIGIKSQLLSSPDVKRKFICDRCGVVMEERQCKITCPKCGNRFDCSDLNIYYDELKPAQK
jgi:hypothetical protein